MCANKQSAAEEQSTLPAHHFEDMDMGVAKIVGILLITAGALGLVYGGFTYTRETHTAKLGPIALQVQDRQTVYVPILVSAAVLALGVFLLLVPRGK
jgi:hypothetical protein